MACTDQIAVKYDAREKTTTAHTQVRAVLLCYKNYKKKKKSHYCVTSLLGDPNGNRTRVPAVKGRCLNRLTIGPYI